MLYQIPMRALLNNTTFLDHEDLIGITNRFKAVCDHNNGFFASIPHSTSKSQKEIVYVKQIGLSVVDAETPHRASHSYC